MKHCLLIYEGNFFFLSGFFDVEIKLKKRRQQEGGISWKTNTINILLEKQSVSELLISVKHLSQTR